MECLSDYNARELDVYTRLSENQLRTINEPNPGIFVAESPVVIERALKAGYVPVSALICKDVVDNNIRDVIEYISLKFPRVPIYSCSETVLSIMRGYELTRGILCAFERKEYEAVENIIKGAKRIAILNDIENPSNIGAIMRSAAAMFIDAVILTHGCSDPLYRRAARVSVGTVFQVPWTVEAGKRSRCDESADIFDIVRECGFKLVALALRDDSVSIDDKRLKDEERLAVVLGNEGYGLPDECINKCDYTAKIPMASGIDSLNVAAASAVAFWELHKA